jgi:hypothetical protein
MLATNPKMLPRLDEIEDDLVAHRARAEHEAWLGEIEGIDRTLTFLRDKRAEGTAFTSERRSTSANQPSAPGTDHDINTSGTFADVNLETRRPDRPVPPRSGRSGRLCICWPPPSRRAGTCPR